MSIDQTNDKNSFSKVISIAEQIQRQRSELLSRLKDIKQEKATDCVVEDNDEQIGKTFWDSPHWNSNWDSNWDSNWHSNVYNDEENDNTPTPSSPSP